MYTINNEDVISADLLSVEEANKLPKWILANGDWWWLQSKGYYMDYTAGVNSNGVVDDIGNFVNGDDYGVRPALVVVNIPSLRVGETVEAFGLVAQYIGNNKVLLCENIFFSRFDEKSNKYKTSEIKQKLDEWFKKKKEEQ